jgi:hypothetical protein
VQFEKYLDLGLHLPVQLEVHLFHFFEFPVA